MTNENSLLLFKQDFWKDKRKLQIIEREGEQFLEKTYESEAELNIEYSTISALISNNFTDVPTINQIGTKTALMPYYKGIRIFNLLVELDFLIDKFGDDARKTKLALVERCSLQQRKIQEVLIKRRNYTAYPISKVENVIYLLLGCLNIGFDKNALEHELSDISSYWESAVNIPFRDATPKNMLLHNETLSLVEFENEVIRREYLEKCYKNGTFDKLLEFPIINYDFCSCLHDTTPEDDVISLRYHERTWTGKLPSPTELVWFGNYDAKRAAISFLFRYFRFGGRRAAYRILHSNTSLSRFKYDNDVFYFSQLPLFMETLWPECKFNFPYLLHLIHKLTDALEEFAGAKYDLFDECGFSINEKPYVDVYPN